MGGLKRREDWDNKSWPTHNIPFDYYATDQVTPDIFTACEQACRADPKCFQWVTWKQECAIETNFKLGVERVAIPEHFTSGWFTDRIDAFIAANGGCTEPNWRPNPD